MKRMIILSLAAGLSTLAAQTPQAPPAQAAPPAAAQPATGPTPKSPEETKALQALGSTQDPDAIIKAVDEFVVQFPESQFKEQVYTMQADAYTRKSPPDRIKAQVAAENALKENPKAIQPHIMIGEFIVAQTGERDLDKNEKLASAESHLKTALDLLTNGPKPNPQIPDAQWAEIKAFMTAQIHNDFGMLALTRKNYDNAIAEFKTAMAGDPQQGAYGARLAKAYQAAGKNNEAIAECDRMLADPQLHPAIKQFVTSVRADAVKAGGQPAAPAEKK